MAPTCGRCTNTRATRPGRCAGPASIPGPASPVPTWLAIVIGTAATLHAHGITGVATVQDAAAAPRPIAGPFAEVVFAAGTIGTSPARSGEAWHRATDPLVET
jgi:hypothetical protein